MILQDFEPSRLEFASSKTPHGQFTLLKISPTDILLDVGINCEPAAFLAEFSGESLVEMPTDKETLTMHRKWYINLKITQK